MLGGLRVAIIYINFMLIWISSLLLLSLKYLRLQILILEHQTFVGRRWMNINIHITSLGIQIRWTVIIKMLCEACNTARTRGLFCIPWWKRNFGIISGGILFLKCAYMSMTLSYLALDELLGVICVYLKNLLSILILVNRLGSDPSRWTTYRSF